MCASADCAGNTLYIDAAKILLSQSTCVKDFSESVERSSSEHCHRIAFGIYLLNALYMLQGHQDIIRLYQWCERVTGTDYPHMAVVTATGFDYLYQCINASVLSMMK